MTLVVPPLGLGRGPEEVRHADVTAQINNILRASVIRFSRVGKAEDSAQNANVFDMVVLEVKLLYLYTILASLLAITLKLSMHTFYSLGQKKIQV